MKGGFYINRETYKKIVKCYEQLALGSIRDCVRLLFCDEISPEELKKMELSNIAEIKGTRGSISEIKFYDRLRALQCLQELSDEERERASPDFYTAFENGMRALNEKYGDSEDEAVPKREEE